MKNCVTRNDSRFGKQLLIVAFSFAALFQAGAAPSVFLNNNNATVGIDPFTQAGVSQWTVDGINKLNQQWFWYGICSSPEQAINTIGAPVITPISAYSAKLVYTSPGLFDIQVTYTLQ